MIVSDTGGLIEALGCRVKKTHIDKYKSTEYHLVCLGALADRRDREQVVAFADWCLGEEYDFVTLVSIAFTLLFGGKFDSGMDGQTMCSGLVARALERTNAIFDRTPSHITPADLARYFNVTPTGKGTAKGVIPRTKSWRVFRRSGVERQACRLPAPGLRWSPGQRARRSRTNWT